MPHVNTVRANTQLTVEWLNICSYNNTHSWSKYTS